MSKKKSSRKQAILIQSLEGIGDILVYEVKRFKDKLVLNGLKKIFGILERLVELQKQKPTHFERLMLSDDYFENSEKNQEKVQFELVVNRDKYLTGFLAPINQFVRVYEASIDSRNEIISGKCALYLVYTLAKFSTGSGNELYLLSILDKFKKMLFSAIDKNDKTKYFLSSCWYIQIVFDQLNDKEKFSLDYLDIFNKQLFNTLKYLVEKRNKDTFDDLISVLTDGILLTTNEPGLVWQYGHIILHDDLNLYERLVKEFAVEEKLSQLTETEKQLYSKNDLDSWIEKFNELKSIVVQNINKKLMDTAEKKEQDIFKQITSRFKLLQLHKVIFCIGGYCLFKEEYRYIRYIWEYKQPPDANGIFVGNEIIPNSLEKLINLYINEKLFEDGYDYWEGHHGESKYNKLYFLLFLAKILQEYRPNDSSEYIGIKYFNLPQVDVALLFDLKLSFNEYYLLLDEVKNNKKLLGELGFNANADELFDNKVKIFLLHLEEEIDAQLKNKESKT